MVQPACALLQWKKRSHGGGFWAYYWCCCFLWLAFNSVQLTKADAVTDCLNACHETDIACRAKCVPVPFGGVDSVTHTGNCIATCQRNFPIDPRAQSSCYSSCFTEFVNPPPHLQRKFI
ncbi:hypothetical protein HMI54_013417 [Coelomomyces lativittatus]|nr:hypothetical protein HMI55_005573 [Coelomomyces lativittatus]KAJ1497669.1 hypothetical protein HMI54_013417 [Coelomomyces lativittatus]